MITASSCQRRILLVPDDNLYLAFRLPPLIKKAGCEVDLLAVSGNSMVHSRYPGTVEEVPDHDALYTRLVKLLRDPQRLWSAVIVTHEKTMRRLVATGDADLLKEWQPGALDPAVREFLLSKFGLATVGQQWQLNLPPSQICHSLAEILDFGQETGWPIIIKPPEESGGRGVAKFHSSDEVAGSQSKLVFPLLAQKYIQGRRGVADMLCSEGRSLAWLASFSIQRREGEFTPSTARHFLPMPGLRPLVEGVAQSTKFEGFCGFDWIQEAGTGRYYLIEFHPRAPSGFRFGRVCGVDFPAAIAAWQEKKAANFPMLTQPAGTSVKAYYFTGDLFRCLRQRDWRGFKWWLPGSGAAHDIYWDDLPLMTGWAVQRCREWFQKRMGVREKMPDAKPVTKSAAMG